MAPDIIFFDTHLLEVYEDRVEVVQDGETLAVYREQEEFDAFLKGETEVTA